MKNMMINAVHGYISFITLNNRHSRHIHHEQVTQCLCPGSFYHVLGNKRNGHRSLFHALCLLRCGGDGGRLAALHAFDEVYETIVTRDLVQKYTLPDTLVLQRLSEFLMDNISNLTSPNKVSQLLTANETPTNHVTVGKYIKYLCNAFVFYDIKRYDIRGKKYLESSEKFYLCDSLFWYWFYW